MYIKKEVSLTEAKKHITNGGLVYTTNEDRGIGKTESIIAYSIWANKPILVRNALLVKFYKSLNPNVKVFVINDSLVGLSKTYDGFGFLVDDPTKEIDVKALRVDYGIKVSGFITAEGVYHK